MALAGTVAFAGSAALSDSVELYFPCGSSQFNVQFGENRAAIDSIAALVATLRSDTSVNIGRIALVGSASPEGSIALNQRLSARRVSAVLDYMRDFGPIPDSVIVLSYTGRDWQGLRALVQADYAVPARQQVLDLLDDIIAQGDAQPGGRDKLADLKAIDGGEAYRYLSSRYFPGLRRTLFVVDYNTLRRLPPIAAGSALDAVPLWFPTPGAPALAEGTRLPAPGANGKPFFMALKTNMLADALAIPNIGAELYLGKGWTAGADWYYGWWDNDPRHRYWRLYGGDVSVRKWFGSAAARKPLTGHHLGVYAQMLIYDFEFGGKGQMAGKPGCNIWQKANYGAGIEYGYSLPIKRRLNIDFTIGIGYLGGNYYEYQPENGCYVWLKTVKRRTFGPTKAQVSLVWLIGRGNTNKKGGWR